MAQETSAQAAPALDEELMTFVKRILDQPEYRAGLLIAAREGKLDPRIEQMLWHYRLGKPAETVKHTDPSGSAPVTMIHRVIVRPDNDGSDGSST